MTPSKLCVGWPIIGGMLIGGIVRLLLINCPSARLHVGKVELFHCFLEEQMEMHRFSQTWIHWARLL